MNPMLLKNCSLRYIIPILVLLVLLSSSAFAGDKLKVTFVNPGVSGTAGATGSFWVMVSDFMKAAAQDLGIDLEILYAERNHIRMRELGVEVAQRAQPPDYMVIVNEMLQAGAIVEAAQKAGVKVFIMLNSFVDKQVETYGQPREKVKQWIGTLIPNNQYAGYAIAKHILDRTLAVGRKAGDGKVHLVAIAGDHVTPASVERVKGLNQALFEYADVELKQLFYAQWRRDNAFTITGGALYRYPETAAIWAANDPIALGALEAAEKTVSRPARNFLSGG